VNYDIFCGHHTLSQLQLKIDFSNNTCQWFENEISFHPCLWFKDKEAIPTVLLKEPKHIDKAQQQQSFATDVK